MLFKTFLAGRSVPQIIILSILLILLVGGVDHLTGFELSFSIFYIIPIALASWYASLNIGIFLSLFSAIIWFVADLLSGHVYSYNIILFWNVLVRLGFFIIVSLLLARMKISFKMVADLADTDGLTGLFNGRAFRESAMKMFEFCGRIKRPTALAYIDLDNFKQINDTFGHTEGDRVLKVVANTLSKYLRNTDIVGRMGGDEFAIVLPDTDRGQAVTVIEKMHLHLKEEIGIHNWPIGFSIGVTVFIVPPKTVDDAIKKADNLMYRVKKAGKGNIFFEEYTETQ